MSGIGYLSPVAQLNSTTSSSALTSPSASARRDGLLMCPEGGATLAAYRRALVEGLVGAEDEVLLFNCANGNKYPLADRSRRLKLDEASATAL